LLRILYKKDLSARQKGLFYNLLLVNTPIVQIPATGYDQQQLAAARTRTRMANERTLLTYVHTSLALLAFGLTLLQLHPGRGLGYGALATSCMVWG
jgi:putative membrane protein